jgi:hypothetical protein
MLAGFLIIFRTRERFVQSGMAMPNLLDNLRLLESAQGYAMLDLPMQANRELEQMSADTRLWPEVLEVKLAIFTGLDLWEMVEIVAWQLSDCSAGNPRLLAMAETACRQTRDARRRGKANATNGAPRMAAI